VNDPDDKTQRAESMDFVFVGEALALDLVNTDVVLRGKRHDFLSVPEDARCWWDEATLHHPGREVVEGEAETTCWDAELLDALKQLRAALRSLFLALIERQPIQRHDLEVLNQAAAGDRQLAIGSDGTLIPVYRTRMPATGAILLPIAFSALQLITESERERLRKCDNESCSCMALFYDTTRNATRRWCSSNCMHRSRSRERYRREKEALAGAQR